MKTKAWYRYTMRLSHVECPKCGKNMYCMEPEIWLCEDTDCNEISHDEELEWVVLKEKEHEQY